MQRALLLDRNYMALSVVPWKKAVKLMVKGKAEPVAGSDTVRQVKGAESDFDIPSIIRLLVVIPWKAHMGRMKFSRKNVLIRDAHKCQYCGIRVGKAASTIDHVIPKSRGGKTDYANCVTCCKNCNNDKADRTPVEANIKLIQKPKKPTFLTLYRHFLENPPEEWCDYIIGLET
jgi:5-methylcytosine-specific restriction endonuclease McrA